MKLLNTSELKFACDFLRSNEIVAFPTDTVYGLGGNAYSDAAVAKIYQCKNRSQLNPVSVCYSSFDRAFQDVETNKEAILLAEHFLPGAITLVLNKKNNSQISWLCSAGKTSLGVRVPNNPIALKLLELLEFPLAAPSANQSSELSTTTAKDVCNSLSHYEQLVVLDGGPCKLGIESTIIDLTDSQPKILREGAISKEEIEDKCGFNLTLETNHKFKHYKPNKPIRINVNQITSENSALLAFGTPLANAKYCLNLSPTSDLIEAAKNLFSMLRELDTTDANEICVMPIPNLGIGEAINDRLNKAAQQDSCS